MLSIKSGRTAVRFARSGQSRISLSAHLLIGYNQVQISEAVQIQLGLCRGYLGIMFFLEMFLKSLNELWAEFCRHKKDPRLTRVIMEQGA